MAKRVKTSRKTLLKQPDQFLSVSEKMLIYFTDHRAPVITAITGIILIFLSAVGFRFYQQTQMLAMESIYFEMQKVRDEGKDKDSKQVTAELNKQLEKFSDGQQKQRASLLLADWHYVNKEYDRAIPIYSEVLKSAGPAQLQYPIAQAGLAHSLEGKKDYLKAIDAYKATIEKSGGYPLFNIYLSLSRCYELNQDAPSALLVLREMKNKYAAHSRIDQVDQRIKKLSSIA